MTSLDRFAYGLPDKQQEAAAAECEHCGNELYRDYEAYQPEDGSLLCSEACVLRSLGVREVTV